MIARKYVKEVCEELNALFADITFDCDAVEPVPRLKKNQRIISTYRLNLQDISNLALLHVVAKDWEYAKKDLIQRIKNDVQKHQYSRYTLLYRTAVRGGRGRFILIAHTNKKLSS